MLLWLQTNMGTLVVVLVLAIALGAIVRKVLRDKRAGRHACGCDCGSCSGCAMQGQCHKK